MAIAPDEMLDWFLVDTGLPYRRNVLPGHTKVQVSLPGTLLGLPLRHVAFRPVEYYYFGFTGEGVTLRQHQEVPIIFLTALSAEEDKLLGYELGADDYVTKPFTMSILYAKTMALIKRSRGTVRTGDRLQTEVTIIRSREAALRGRDVFESALTELSGAVPSQFRTEERR